MLRNLLGREYHRTPLPPCESADVHSHKPETETNSGIAKADITPVTQTALVDDVMKTSADVMSKFSIDDDALTNDSQNSVSGEKKDVSDDVISDDVTGTGDGPTKTLESTDGESQAKTDERKEENHSGKIEISILSTLPGEIVSSH